VKYQCKVCKGNDLPLKEKEHKCNLECYMNLPSEPSPQPQSEDWEKEFDNHFEGMDVWIYMDQANDPKGISSKVMDGKKVVKQFISQELTTQREEIKKDTEKLKRNDFVKGFYEKGWNNALDQVLELLSKGEK
jgi:hypothetical protein